LTDYASFKHGGTTFPLTASTSNSLLKDADAVSFYMLDFFASVLNTHLGSRLAAQATAAGMTISNAVAMKVPYDPAPYLLEEQFKFPLLAVYRKRSVMRGNISYRHDDSEFAVAYILPPLSAAQAEQLLPILRAVGRVLDNRADMGFDPAYTPPGGSAGQSVWGSSYANLESITFTEETYGAYAGMGDLTFPSWVGSLKVAERDMYIAGSFDALDGVDITENVVGEDGTTVAEVLEAATHKTPTVTALSASTGTTSGGTAVTITGTNFRSGAHVFFGSVEATSVVVASATSITCVTPANSAGLYDVTVSYLDDGQSGSLEASFTYT
jgi:hypothetical protein